MLKTAGSVRASTSCRTEISIATQNGSKESFKQRLIRLITKSYPTSLNY
jgi:hypothetical protein